MEEFLTKIGQQIFSEAGMVAAILFGFNIYQYRLYQGERVERQTTQTKFEALFEKSMSTISGLTMVLEGIKDVLRSGTGRS